MRKARQALSMAKETDRPESRQIALRAGWESLTRTHRLLAEIPLAAVDDDVMTRQLAVQRYATALLVRLRRLLRNESGALDNSDEEFEDED